MEGHFTRATTVTFHTSTEAMLVITSNAHHLIVVFYGTFVEGETLSIEMLTSELHCLVNGCRHVMHSAALTENVLSAPKFPFCLIQS